MVSTSLRRRRTVAVSRAPTRDMGRTFGNPVKVMPREQTDGSFPRRRRSPPSSATFKTERCAYTSSTLYVRIASSGGRRCCGPDPGHRRRRLSRWVREQGFLMSRNVRALFGRDMGRWKIMNLAKNEIMLNNFQTVLRCIFKARALSLNNLGGM